MIKAENFIIADREEAQKYGFNIAGDVCFIFELGHYSIGCLGQDITPIKAQICGGTCELPSWRFDTIDHEAVVYSFEEENLSKAIQKAQAIAKAVAALEQAREINDGIFANLLHVFKCV